MKVPPLTLSQDINRVAMPLPFSPDFMLRYSLSLPQASVSSSLLDVRNQMPTHLTADPRMWSREDVATFLKWFEREFELPVIDLSKFCMNGKALCMLTKGDLADRAPGAGDILHNTLQFLLRDAPQVPPSPITPHHPLLSPSPITQSTPQPWSVMSPDLHSLGHFLQQNGSVTLSPAPSEQSGGSPRHIDSTTSISLQGYSQFSSAASTGSGHSASHSDSEDSSQESSPRQRSPLPPPTTSASSLFPVQALASLKKLTEYQKSVAAAAAATAITGHEEKYSPAQMQSSVQMQIQQLPHQNGDEPMETGTNGRLLWDFLQQLLNDPQQRHSRLISWKNRETGVFKIVDPPGLAKLWGIQKNHLSMNYDKMSRALRYYYRVNILRKVQGERHCYQFLRNPSELKNIKNISMLRAAPLQQQQNVPSRDVLTQMAHDEEGPTDLSMSSLQNRYSCHLQERPGDEAQNLSVESGDFMAVKKEETQEASYD